MDEPTELPQGIPYVIVDPDGRIVQRGAVNADMWHLQGDGARRRILLDTVADGRYDLVWSPDGRSLAVRPLFPVVLSRPTIRADGVDAAVLTGIPEGAWIVVDGERHQIAGGELTLTATAATTYELAADHWPFQPWSAQVIAT